MKKLFLITILLLGMLGCSKDRTLEIDPSAASEFMGVGISENGVYYLAESDNGNYVAFYDFNAQKSVPLCNKANCRHDSLDCHAYEIASYQNTPLATISFYHDNLYLFYTSYEGDDTSADVIMKADIDGTNREEFYKIPNHGLVNQAFIFNNNLYLSCNVVGELDETSSGITGTVLYFYNSENGETNVLDSSKDNPDLFLYFVGFKDEKAYYISSDASKKERPVYEFDPKTGENLLINAENTLESVFMIDDEFYFADNDTAMIKAYNIFDKSISDVASFKPHEGKFLYQSGNGVIRIKYVTDPGTLDSKMYTQVYDIEKGAFLFDDYSQNDDVMKKLDNGMYIGTVNYEYILFDENMKGIKID